MKKVYERFIEYAKYPTQSCEESETCPSTQKQWDLAKRIVSDLTELGLEVSITDNCYIYATLEANAKADAVIGLVAHIDTSSDAPDCDIKPSVKRYDGVPLLLNEKEGLYLSEKEYPSLAKYKGQDLIVTDGTTLLGADDKAGVCEIIAAVEYIIENNIPHGTIKIGFTPDEEIGRGADLFDVEGFCADYAYTIDGGAIGEIEYENFNGASAAVRFNGISIHPGSAKGKMKNAVIMAHEFNSLLPEGETPADTEGYEGFYHLMQINGTIEKAELKYIIRDHDKDLFEKRKETIFACARAINEKWGEGSCEAVVEDSYYNMKEKIEPHMYVVDRAKKAMEDCGVKAEIVPIRGGTDGARLSFEGLPCPNLCTGGENFHSRFEYIPIPSMEKITEIIVKIIADRVEK